MLKTIYIAIALMSGCLISNSHAAQKEFGYSILSCHVMGDRQLMSKFSNKVNNKGLIYNPLISYKVTKNDPNEKGGYDSAMMFAGGNSVGTPMAGLIIGSGYWLNENFQSGAVFGGYLQDTHEFAKRGLDLVFPGYRGVGLVPVFGIEINFKAQINKDVFIKLNNILTPMITNHSISIGFEF